jgi:hypothetical protein
MREVSHWVSLRSGCRLGHCPVTQHHLRACTDPGASHGEALALAATSNFSPNSFTARTTSSAASCHCRSRARAHAPLYSAARASSCTVTRGLHARPLQGWPPLTRLGCRLEHG